jgi:hypothetical protein
MAYISLQEQLRFAQVQYAELLSSGPAHKTRNKAQRLAELRARLDQLEAAVAALSAAAPVPLGGQPGVSFEELRLGREVIADLAGTVSRLLDGYAQGAPLSWWREQRRIIAEQQRRVRDLRETYGR